LIGRRQITLIEDSPSEYVLSKRKNSPFLDFLKKELCGPLAVYNRFGDNPYCKCMILTTRKVSGIYRDKKETVLVNIYDLWEKSSQEKRKKILFQFSLTTKDVDSLREKEIFCFPSVFQKMG
jgi:hypothetical protein